MTPYRFAEALAARLSEVVPDGFGVRAGADGVWLDMPDGTTCGCMAAIDTESAETVPVDPFETVAVMTLSAIQDAVSRTTTRCWPSADAAGRHMALPHAKREGPRLHAWFGDAGQPAVSLRPIDLDD